MILSNRSIKTCVSEGLIAVRPRFDEEQLRPFGLRIHLGDEILLPERDQIVDLANWPTKSPTFNKLNIRESSLTLQPRDFVLACSAESFRVDSSIICRIDGRSTLARLGIMIHCTAELMDNIHDDYRSIVLELVNLGPFTIVLPHLYGIGLAIFETVTTPAESAGSNKQYENQSSTLPPNLDFQTPKFSEF